MHSVHEINPRQRRKKQRGERRWRPAAWRRAAGFRKRSAERRGGCASPPLLSLPVFRLRAKRVLRCLASIGDLARCFAPTSPASDRSITYAHILPSASRPAMTKIVGFAPPPRLTASLCSSLPPLCQAAGLHLYTRCIHLYTLFTSVDVYGRKRLYTFVRLRRLLKVVFYFLGGEATLLVPLSVNPCSNTGSGFPNESGLKNCRTVR